MFIEKIMKVFLVTLSLYGETYAQTETEFYSKNQPARRGGIGFRVGTNYSSPTVTTAVDKRTNTTTSLAGVTPRFGYYISGFTYKDLVPNQVLFRLDATMQMKGVGAEYNGTPTVKASYYYLGLSPQIGLQLTNQFTVYVGAEANTLISKVNPWGKTYPFEFGGVLRFAYQVGNYGLEAGYFKGFTRYDSFETINLPGPKGLSSNDFYNQTLQVGLFYKLSR